MIDKLNAEFGGPIVKLTNYESKITVTCKFKNCPLRLTYANDLDGLTLNKKIKKKYHSHSAHSKKELRSSISED